MPPFVGSGAAVGEKVWQHIGSPIVGNMATKLVKPLLIPHPVSVRIPKKLVGKMLASVDDIDDLYRQADDIVNQSLIENVVAKKGKILFREVDNTLVRDKNAVRNWPELFKEISTSNLPDEQKLERLSNIINTNSRIHGKSILGQGSAPLNLEVVDISNKVSQDMATELVHIIESAKQVGVKPTFDIGLLRDQPTTWFGRRSAPSYAAAPNTVNFGGFQPGDAFHELSHMKDFQNPLYNFGMSAIDSLGTAATLSFPAAYVAGDKIKEAIPGKADDHVVDFLKSWGPEVYLATRAANIGINEYRAYKNTKRLMDAERAGKFKLSVPSAEFAPNASYDDIVKAHQLSLGSYPISTGLVYGGMRGGAALYDMNKEGNVATQVVTGPAEAIMGSIKRGYHSIPHFGSILKSLMLSSPSAPPASTMHNLIRFGVPLGLAYGAHELIVPHGYSAGEAIPAIQGNIL